MGEQALSQDQFSKQRVRRNNSPAIKFPRREFFVLLSPDSVRAITLRGERQVCKWAAQNWHEMRASFWWRNLNTNDRLKDLGLGRRILKK
jgi:hypothetical protein